MSNFAQELSRKTGRHECKAFSANPWDDPVRTDSELRQISFGFLFELVGRAIAQGRVAAVEVEEDVKVVSYFQAGFFEGGKSVATGPAVT